MNIAPSVPSVSLPCRPVSILSSRWGYTGYFRSGLSNTSRSWTWARFLQCVAVHPTDGLGRLLRGGCETRLDRPCLHCPVCVLYMVRTLMKTCPIVSITLDKTRRMRSLLLALPPLVILLSIFCLHIAAVPTNVTIDDTTGDPETHLQITYSPPLSWVAGQSCNSTRCTAQPDPSKVKGGTWHEGVFRPFERSTMNIPGVGETITAEMEFNGTSILCVRDCAWLQVLEAYSCCFLAGTAVYVYAIITRSSDFPVGNTNLSFYLDGATSPDSNFILAPNGNTEYHYNQLVYSNTSMDLRWHNLTIASGGTAETEMTMFLLDYVVYTCIFFALIVLCGFLV